jgi:hypothetical protein
LGCSKPGSSAAVGPSSSSVAGPHGNGGSNSLKLVDSEHSIFLLENKEAEEWGNRGVPVYVQLYSTTNFYGLSDFLKKFNEDLGFEVGGCGKGWVKWYCQGGGGHLLLRRRLCGHRHFCPNDAEVYTRLRVNRAWRVFEEFAIGVRFGVYVTHLVFTFPKEVWFKGVENPSLLAKCVYKTFEQYKSGMFGGVLGIHFWHSGRPQDGWYPHVHVLLFNAVLCRFPQLRSNGLGLGRKRDSSFFFKRKRPYFNRTLLKLKFKWAIREVFGFEWVGLPNIYLQYYKVCAKNEARIRHKLRYIFRLPISDLKNVDFSSLSEEEASFVWKLLNYRCKRIRWFGFLADGVKRRYLAVAGVGFERLEVLFATFKRVRSICPLHGIKMVRLGDYGAG